MGFVSNAAETALIGVADSNQPAAVVALDQLQGRAPIVWMITALVAVISLAIQNPGVPAALAVAVALGLAAIRSALAQLGAGQRSHLRVHEFLNQPGDTVAQHIGVLAGHELVDQVSSGHPVALGHRGVSFVDPWTDRRS